MSCHVGRIRWPKLNSLLLYSLHSTQWSSSIVRRRQLVSMMAAQPVPGGGRPEFPLPHKSGASDSSSSPPFGVSKASWIVRTESNVLKEIKKRPSPPCVKCNGSGRVDCHYCQGRGRTNSVHLAMLPKGEWPKWCKACGGSGLEYCSRCLGTGEYRDIMGFHFMKMSSN